MASKQCMARSLVNWSALRIAWQPYIFSRKTLRSYYAEGSFIVKLYEDRCYFSSQ